MENLNSPSPTIIQQWIDRFGIGLSITCATHCFATSFLLILSSIAGIGFLFSETVELFLVSLAILLAAGSLCWGFRLHKSIRLFLLLAAAILLIVAGRTIVPHSLEYALVIPGALLIAGIHWLNLRLCRQCREC